MIRPPIALVLALALGPLTSSCRGPAAGEPPAGEPRSGRWRGVFETPGGELPFELVFDRAGGSLRAELVNGDEHAPFSSVERSAEGLVLSMPHYDSRLVLKVLPGGRALEGRWERRTRGAAPFRLPLRAELTDAPRFTPRTGAGPPDTAALEGRWEVRFADADEPSVGLFEADPDGSARGTFLAATGDERFLAGLLDGRVLRLSGFDGARAVLVRAEIGPQGIMRGDLWSRDTYHVRFEGTRTAGAARVLPDGFSLARWNDAVPLGSVQALDLDGRAVRLDDPRFAGGARLIEVFGTWCPNCNDAIVDLVALGREYRDRGLSIVGLAFELEDDPARNRRLVEAFRDRYGVDFPLLLGGTVDDARSRKALPGLEGALAYPTLLLAAADGRVVAVHVGWAGPATGGEHARLMEELRARIERLLD